MAKKRKLNSRNPKYNSEVINTEDNVARRELLCVVKSESPYRKGRLSEIPIYGVWLK